MNLRKKAISLVFLLFSLGALLTFQTAVQAEHPFTPTVIDDAMNQPLQYFGLDSADEGTNPGNCKRSKAFYYLTLVAHYDPTAVASDGASVKDRVLGHIRNVISGGKEPDCAGNLMGWSHNMVAQGLLLAKNTPVVWDNLSVSEKEKCDWLMKGLAIAGNWAFNDHNDYKTGLNHLGNFAKTNNPNYLGYLQVIIAASLYFGDTTLNDIFAGFDYDAYIAKFSSLGFTNIVSCWTTNRDKSGKSVDNKLLMERGGKDTYGGSGSGVKVPFVWYGIGSSDRFGIFKKLVSLTYDKVVFDRIDFKEKNGSDASCYIITKGTSSPYLGMYGMMDEFDTTDSKGVRSDISYAYESWMNNLPTRVNLWLLGYWRDDPEVTIPMRVGSEDLIYKLINGWHSYSMGTFWDSNANRVKDYYEADRCGDKGYFYDKDIWRKLLYPDPANHPISSSPAHAGSAVK